MVVVQAIIFAWFTGAIIRNEQSLYLWVEYSDHARKFGTSDALFGAFLYLLYYSFFFELVYLVLRRYITTQEQDQPFLRADVMIYSFWGLFTFLVFGNSIFSFLRNLPTNVWNGWLLIGWICGSVIIGRSFLRLLDGRRAQNNVN